MGNTNRNIANPKQNGVRRETLEVMTSFQGPLPSPEILQGFESVLPGAAERIMRMAEAEQESRHNIERRYSIANICIVTLGVISALIALSVISFLIKYSIDNDQPAVASILSSTSLIGVVGLFIWVKRRREDGG
jgi:uncharacterized membrane protein